MFKIILAAATSIAGTCSATVQQGIKMSLEIAILD